MSRGYNGEIKKKKRRRRKEGEKKSRPPVSLGHRDDTPHEKGATNERAAAAVAAVGKDDSRGWFRRACAAFNGRPSPSAREKGIRRAITDWRIFQSRGRSPIGEILRANRAAR